MKTDKRTDRHVGSLIYTVQAAARSAKIILHAINCRERQDAIGTTDSEIRSPPMKSVHAWTIVDGDRSECWQRAVSVGYQWASQTIAKCRSLTSDPQGPII